MKRFQGKHILSYFFFVLIGSALFALILTFFSGDSYTIAYSNNNLQIGKTSSFIFKSILNVYWIALIFGSVFIVITAMIITHRVAGPLFKIEQAVDKMLLGDFTTRITLRKNDEGKELTEKINQLNTLLENNLSSIAEHALNLDKQLDRLADIASSTENPQKLLEGIDQLKSISVKLSGTVSTSQSKPNP